MNILSREGLSEGERNAIEELENSLDLKISLSKVSWRPTHPFDLKLWSGFFKRIDAELTRLLQDFPDLICTHKRVSKTSLEDTEKFLVELFSFLAILLNVGFNRRSFSDTSKLEIFLKARNARIMLAVIDVLISLAVCGTAAWVHRPAPSQRISVDAQYWGITNSQTLFNEFIRLATDGFKEESKKQDEDGEEVEETYLDRSPHYASSLESEEDELNRAVLVFDSQAEKNPDFSYENDGFSRLTLTRKQMCPSFALRTKVLCSNVLLNSGVSMSSRSQIAKDASFVLFNHSFPKRDQDIVASGRILEEYSISASKGSNFYGLISRLPGRGLLIESIRKLLVEADADPETKVGLSFARVAEKKSTHQFWVALESQLVICTNITAQEAGISALIDGGVVRSILTWVKRTLNEEENFDEEEGRCFALCAGLFFFMAAGISNSVTQPLQDSESLIQGCTKLVNHLISKPTPPTCAEDSLVCAIISCISCFGQTSRRNPYGREHRRLASVTLTAEETPLSKLLVSIFQNSAKLSGGMIRCAAEFVVETVRNSTLAEQISKGPLGEAMLHFMNNFQNEAPVSLESLFAFPKHLLVFFSKSTYGKQIFSRSAFAEFFATFRNKKFYSLISSGSFAIGQAMFEFFNESQITVFISFCIDELKALFKDIESLPDDEQQFCLLNTLRFTAEILNNRELAKAFLDSEGLKLVLTASHNGERKQFFEPMSLCIRSVSTSFRKEVLESICGFVLQEKLSNHGNSFTLMEWLCETLNQVVFSRPQRNTDGLFSNDVCYEAFSYLSRWDMGCERPSRLYLKLLSRISLLLTRNQSLTQGGRVQQSRTRFGPHEIRLCNHIISAIENILQDDPDRALIRAHVILSQQPPCEELLKMISASGFAQILMQMSCEALKRSEMSQTAVRILFALTDPIKEVEETTLQLGISACETLSKLDFTQVSEQSLVGLMMLLSKLLSPTRTWRRTFQQAPKPKPEFVANPVVVDSISDMGFHVAHIETAQEKLKSNDVEEITNYLVTHPQPITEEDEMRLAVWLSLKGGDDGDKDASSTSKVDELTSEEALEKKKIDDEESNNRNLVAILRKKVLHLLPLVSSLKKPIKYHLVAPPANLNSQTALTRPSLNRAFEAVVFITNQTNETLVISSRTSRVSSILIEAKMERQPIHTFQGAQLLVKRQNEMVIGMIEARWKQLEVTIEESDLTPSTSTSLRMMEVREAHARSSTLQMSQEGTVQIRFVNEMENAIQINAFIQEIFHEKFCLEPGQSVFKESKQNFVWMVTNLPSQETLGAFLVPDRGAPFVARISPSDAVNNIGIIISTLVQETFYDDGKTISVSDLMNAFSSRNDFPLLASIMEYAIEKEWSSLDKDALTKLALEYLFPTKDSTSGLKRDATDAELLDQDDVAVGDSDSRKKKKKNHLNLFEESVTKKNLENPSRAHAIALLDRLRCSLDEDIYRNLQETFSNAFEVDAVFSLLSHSRTDHLQLNRIISALPYEPSSLALCLYSILQRKSDDVYQFRKLAYLSFLKKPANTKLTLLSFQEDIPMRIDLVEKFGQAIAGQLKLEKIADQIFVVDCEFPKLNLDEDMTGIEHLLDLIEEKVQDVGLIVKVLTDLVIKIPRFVSALARRENFIKRVIDWFCEKPGKTIHDLPIITLLRFICSYSNHSRSCVARFATERFSNDRGYSLVHMLLFCAGARFVRVMDEEQHITDLVLDKLSVVNEASESQNLLLSLLMFLSSREVREIVSNEKDENKEEMEMFSFADFEEELLINNKFAELEEEIEEDSNDQPSFHFGRVSGGDDSADRISFLDMIQSSRNFSAPRLLASMFSDDLSRANVEFVSVNPSRFLIGLEDEIPQFLGRIGSAGFSAAEPNFNVLNARWGGSLVGMDVGNSISSSVLDIFARQEPTRNRSNAVSSRLHPNNTQQQQLQQTSSRELRDQVRAIILQNNQDANPTTTTTTTTTTTSNPTSTTLPPGDNQQQEEEKTQQ